MQEASNAATIYCKPLNSFIMCVEAGLLTDVHIIIQRCTVLSWFKSWSCPVPGVVASGLVPSELKTGIIMANISVTFLSECLYRRY